MKKYLLFIAIICTFSMCSKKEAIPPEVKQIPVEFKIVAITNTGDSVQSPIYYLK
jgi:hypothetical protein